MTIQKDFSLEKFNTFRIAAIAKEFVEINTVDDLTQLIKEGHLKNKAIYVLGGGSNTLFTKNFDGIVIKISLKGIEHKESDGEYEIYQVAAGEDWDKTVEFFVDKNLGGLENLSLIPGEVGASPIQNIGAYGAEVKDVIDYVNAVNITTGDIKRFSNAECKFAYRDSIFKNELKNQYIVTSVGFKLDKDPTVNTTYAEVAKELETLGKANDGLTIKDIREVVIAIRTRKLPDVKKVGTAGSFFKNSIVSQELFENLKKQYAEIPSYPVDGTKIKIPTGWLIEQAGWKGWTSDDKKYGIHPNHALIPVNYGNSTGEEILELTQKIKNSVKEKFGIEIEEEVNLV